MMRLRLNPCILFAIVTFCGGYGCSKSVDAIRDSGLSGSGGQGQGGASGISQFADDSSLSGGSSGQGQGGSGGQGQGGTSGEGSAGTRTLGGDGCHENADCNQPPSTLPGSLCVQSGVDKCAGCRNVTSPCTSDSECQADGASLICDVAKCTCAPVVKSCIAGCMDATDCEAGEVCTARHCVPIYCQSDAECPTDFGCNGGSCSRKTCASDADCSGYCGLGWSCYSMPGVCVMIP